MRYFSEPAALVLLTFSLLAAPGETAADAGGAAAEPLSGPSPARELAPQEVVRIQLEALRANDSKNRGIALAFRFASPSNKRSTGPLSNFIRMIKTGPYRLMLHYEHVVYAPVRTEDNAAAQKVTLVGHGEVMSFVFLLRRLDGPPCDGCWMTDAVIIVPSEEQAA